MSNIHIFIFKKNNFLKIFNFIEESYYKKDFDGEIVKF